MDHTLHFLSGLPRSGSTVLAAILNQHPAIHVSTTSGLVHALDGLANTWHGQPLLERNDPDRKHLARTMRGVIDAFYDHTDRPIIIDKGRGWPIPTIMSAMAQVLGRSPRVIATVRSVPDCMASFVRVARPPDLDEFMRSGQLADHLRAAYITLQAGYNFDPTAFLFVEYDDLVKDPAGQMTRIHDFLELPPHHYDFDHIDGTPVKEDDEELHGYAGMHDIQPRLAAQHQQDPRDVLGRHYRDFCQPEFWLPGPRTLPPVHDLDLQLAAGIKGNAEEGLRLANKLEIEEPWNNRAAFNRGWYRLWQGQLLEGEQLLFRGRAEKVFGNELPHSPMSMWDGKTTGTVLLNLEGGLGDQIHGLRYVREINRRGCRTIVACSGSLAKLFYSVPGVTAVCQDNTAYGVVHDAWVPSMSAIPIFEYEYEDIDGTPYIPRPLVNKGKKFRIGLRWQGNPQFEHEQHRMFPPALLFDAVTGFDVEFICLQRDEGSQWRPYWVDPVPLDHWGQTAEAVASCDLVITSCTSVAHLSGAMGVPTWIVVPILPYYLWAPPGERTVWYDSVRLFRQEIFGEWQQPFDKIHTELRALLSQSSSQIEVKVG